jgi:catechol 2,3-dioxygenase-like lactoylglutathione lyase family enzyme
MHDGQPAPIVCSRAAEEPAIRHYERFFPGVSEVLMPIQQMMMVTVQVRDFDSMIAWYRDVLGLVVFALEPSEFCVLGAAGGSTTVGLATDHPGRIPDCPGVGWAPTFAVDDFDVFVALLRDLGVAFDAEEEGADEGYRLVRVRDPEGNAVGIAAAG